MPSCHEINRTLSAVFIAIGFALSGYFIGHAISQGKLFNRYVSVKGLAEKVVKADQASWTINFTTTGDTLKLVYQGVAHAQKTIQQFLTAQGFQNSEIELKPIAVTDNKADRYGSNTKVNRYSVNSGVIVQTSKVDVVKTVAQKIGALIDKGVVLKGSSIAFRYTKLNAIKPQMLVTATKNAKLAALTFAKNSSSQLGGIRNASQGLFVITSASGNTYDKSTIMKRVRVVTSVAYFLR